MRVKLKLNEIRSIIKTGFFNKRGCVERVAREVCSETFLKWIGEAKSSYKNLMKSPNNVISNLWL
jgi:hypothetical protein